jgi:8-oxo-dGTP pyrophosphatase MutT (NUDIX family)
MSPVTNPNPPLASPIERVRGILLTGRDSLLLIKRIKPHNPTPYWVAPGGGVETYDHSLSATLERELHEELGATVQILRRAFTLRHTIGEKDLQEYFFVCRLLQYDLALRTGPEFNDTSKGDYIPDEVALNATTLRHLNMKTPQLTDWILHHLSELRRL